MAAGYIRISSHNPDMAMIALQEIRKVKEGNNKSKLPVARIQLKTGSSIIATLRSGCPAISLTDPVFLTMLGWPFLFQATGDCNLEDWLNARFPSWGHTKYFPIAFAVLFKKILHPRAWLHSHQRVLNSLRIDAKSSSKVDYVNPSLRRPRSID